jgi:hypothetical protein
MQKKTSTPVPLAERVLVMLERFSELFKQGKSAKYVDFQRELDISQGKFQGWLYGKVERIKPLDAQRLSEQLKMNRDYILFGVGDPFPEKVANNENNETADNQPKDGYKPFFPEKRLLTDSEIEEALFKARFLLEEKNSANMVAHYINKFYDIVMKKQYLPSISGSNDNSDTNGKG